MVRVHINLPGEDEFNDFLDEFQRETARAAAVLGAAYLDALLQQLLTASFVDDANKIEALFNDGFGPLGSFRAKILAAYASGLLTAPDARDLHLIRKIRNDFAHGLHGLSFDDQSIANRCSEFDCTQERFNAEPQLSGNCPVRS